MRVDITYEQALEAFPDEVQRVVTKLRTGKSVHRGVDPSQLEWSFEWQREGQTLVEVFHEHELSPAQLASARLEGAEVVLKASKGRWQRRVALHAVPELLRATLSEQLKREMGPNARQELQDLRERANALGWDIVPIPAPPQFAKIPPDEILQRDPDALQNALDDAVNADDNEEADRISNLLCQYLNAGGRRPAMLEDILTMHSFRRVCLARELGDPLKGKCPRCDGGGCQFCGRSGFVN